jgi:hypothetical protein
MHLALTFLQKIESYANMRESHLDTQNSLVRDALHCSHQVERTLDKLSLREHGRSPSNIANKLSSNGQTLGTKTYKKCCHIDILEHVLFWPWSLM